MSPEEELMSDPNLETDVYRDRVCPECGDIGIVPDAFEFDNFSFCPTCNAGFRSEQGNRQ